MVRAALRLAGAFEALAGVALVFLLLNVAGTIVVRILHALTGGAVNLIWRGSIELAVLALTVIVFASMHRAFVAGAIRVDLFTESLSAGLKCAIDAAFGVLYALFAAAMAWRFGHATATTHARGDATQDLLVPLFYIYGFLTVASVALAAVALVWSLACASGRATPSSPDSHGVQP